MIKCEIKIIQGGYEQFCLDFITFNGGHVLRTFMDQDTGVFKEV